MDQPNMKRENSIVRRKSDVELEKKAANVGSRDEFLFPSSIQ